MQTFPIYPQFEELSPHYLKCICQLNSSLPLTSFTAEQRPYGSSLTKFYCAGTSLVTSWSLHPNFGEKRRFALPNPGGYESKTVNDSQ
ncbi:hypothetical protein AVEN_199287-1 [Araneus ventricosus]|uniref:Uncharacterized protein n=1 Tax=Araneus ventricosus TaxID=182803 RepID=A0A4Y2MXF2_ARAVE|nr:hypothetical protein AVEN_199287-1 [Araneus ventricosus]